MFPLTSAENSYISLKKTFQKEVNFTKSLTRTMLK